MAHWAEERGQLAGGQTLAARNADGSLQSVLVVARISRGRPVLAAFLHQVCLQQPPRAPCSRAAADDHSALTHSRSVMQSYSHHAPTLIYSCSHHLSPLRSIHHTLPLLLFKKKKNQTKNPFVNYNRDHHGLIERGTC